MSRAPHLDRCVPGAAPLGTFVRGGVFAGGTDGEWVASATQHIDVVVSDVGGVPSPTGIAKTLSIVQGRTYLGERFSSWFP